jgi:hypothetical protein
MKCITVISIVAFAVIFLSALFLFMRNYPSDRWFSGVFIVAGGVLLWCARGAGAGAAECTGTTTTETTTAADTEAETEAETRTDNEVSESYAQNTNKN